MASDAVEWTVVGARVDGIEARRAQIRQPRAEAVAQSHAQPENDVRVRRVCNQGRRPQRGVLLKQAVQDDHRVAQSARHYEPEEADAAGRGVVDVRHAFAAAEVFRVRARAYRADRNDEANPVGRGQFPAAKALVIGSAAWTSTRRLLAVVIVSARM